MPAPQLIPPANIVRSVRIDLEDLTTELVDGVRLTTSIGWTDGDRHTIVSRILTHDAVGDIPTRVEDLATIFLWGEAPRDLLRWAQALDGSAQSRRVRRSL